MRFFCPGCGARHEKPDDEIPREGLSIPCEKCGFEITLKAPSLKNQGGPGVAEEQKPPAPDAGRTVAEPVEDHDATIEQPEAGVQESEGGQEPQAVSREATAPRRRPQKPREPFYLGTGRSGEDYRLRDLLCALVVPLDPRKPLVVGLLLFVGNLLFAGLSYLGLLTRSSVGLTIGMVIGGVLFWAVVTLALGVTSRLTQLEMEAGRRVPLSEGVQFVLSRPLAVLGTPFAFLAVILALVAALSVISLIGRIPYAGPILYGLFFLVTFGLALGAVMVAVMMNLVTFSYIPALAGEDLEAWACAKRMLGLLRRHPGSYLLHVLVAGALALGLFILIQLLLGMAMPLIGWLGGKLMGPEFSATLIAIPGGLFGGLYFVLPEAMQGWLQAAAGRGWWYTLGGWLTGLSLLAVVSWALAHVLTYFYAAGVVSYRLLLQKEKN